MSISSSLHLFISSSLHLFISSSLHLFISPSLHLFISSSLHPFISSSFISLSLFPLLLRSIWRCLGVAMRTLLISDSGPLEGVQSPYPRYPAWTTDGRLARRSGRFFRRSNYA